MNSRRLEGLSRPQISKLRPARMIGSAVVALTMTLASQVAAQSTTGDFVGDEISRFAAGLSCTPLIIGETPAPNTISGFTNRIESFDGFTHTSRRVPAVLGVSFGVQAQTKLQDYPFVTMVVTHPPMGEHGIEVESWQTSLSMLGPRVSLFSLEHDYELVPGTWSFEARDGDDVLYRAVFEVVPPQDVPELATICGFENLLS